MLSPVYLDSCTDNILKLYGELNESIIRDIVRRLVNLEFDVSQSAVWQMEKAQEVGGMVYEDVLHEISLRTKKSEDELKKLFEDAGTESMRFDNSVYKKAGLAPLPLSQSPAMLQILTAGYRKCKGELKNLTLTTANMSQSLFINSCNAAYMQVASGAFSQTEAVKRAIESIGDSGAWILYPTGHRDRVDVAVRRAVLTGVSQTCGELQIRQLDDMMWDVVDTTAHMGARTSHAAWQGGRFSYKGRNKNYPDFEESTGYGTAEGLMGPNCRHNFYPAIDGSARMYPKEQLDEWNNHKVTYNGTEYSDREALDIQREMERGIRATKRQAIAYDEAIRQISDDALKAELADGFAKVSVKLHKQEAALSDFLKQTDLKKDYSRTQVNEFGRSMSGKVKQFAEKRLLPKRNKAQIPIEKLSGYALNKNHPVGKHKALVFESVLGYNIDNQDLLVQEVQKGLSLNTAKKRPKTEYGQPFEVTMNILGANGNRAKVKTGWIIDNGAEIPRLTSIYVDN